MTMKYKKTNPYKILMKKSLRKRILRKSRRKWEDNIKNDLRDTGFDISDTESWVYYQLVI
jgi:hypothetical protein